jgi:hypothetical protein
MSRVLPCRLCMSVVDWFIGLRTTRPPGYPVRFVLVRRCRHQPSRGQHPLHIRLHPQHVCGGHWHVFDGYGSQRHCPHVNHRAQVPHHFPCFAVRRTPATPHLAWNRHAHRTDNMFVVWMRDNYAVFGFLNGGAPRALPPRTPP